MTASTKTIKARQLKAGMTLAYSNPLFNTLIEEVQHGANGGVIVYSDLGTSSENFSPNETVRIIYTKRPSLKQVMNTYMSA